MRPGHFRTRALIILVAFLTTGLGALLAWKLWASREVASGAAARPAHQQRATDGQNQDDSNPHYSDSLAETLPPGPESPSPSLPTLSAGETLQRFLDADTVEKRMLYCLPFPGQTGRMSRYPDPGPLGAGVSASRHVPAADGNELNSRRLVFELKMNESARTFPVFVYQTGSGFAVDWQACVEFKDALLRQFSQGTFDLWDEFYAILERGHNYEDESSGETLHWCILSAPGSPGFVQRVFVERDSDLGREIDQRFEFQKEYEVVVRLDRPDRAQGTPGLRLAAISRASWEP